MTTPQDPFSNPPGWTDPYADLSDISGSDPLPPMEPPTTPPAQPPSSPLLTGLIIGVLMIALSVAVFQLLKPAESITATETTTTTEIPQTSVTTSDVSAPTAVVETTTTTTPIPDADSYSSVGSPIPVDRLKMINDGLRVNDNDIPDIIFGTDAETAIGRLVASLGPSTDDTGWQVSTGGFGVCAGDLERVVFFGTYAAIVTKPGGQEIFSGYRQDLTYGDATHEAFEIETLSGLRINDTVSDLKSIYKSLSISFAVDPKLGSVFMVEGTTSGNLLLWGPVEGENDDDRIVGIYSPDVCSP